MSELKASSIHVLQRTSGESRLDSFVSLVMRDSLAAEGDRVCQQSEASEARLESPCLHCKGSNVK